MGSRSGKNQARPTSAMPTFLWQLQLCRRLSTCVCTHYCMVLTAIRQAPSRLTGEAFQRLPGPGLVKAPEVRG